MTRQKALAAIRAAGTANDQAAFLRIYTSHRISFASAREEFETGRRWARFIETRDKASAKPADANQGA